MRLTLLRLLSPFRREISEVICEKKSPAPVETETTISEIDRLTLSLAKLRKSNSRGVICLPETIDLLHK